MGKTPTHGECGRYSTRNVPRVLGDIPTVSAENDAAPGICNAGFEENLGAGAGKTPTPQNPGAGVGRP